MAYANPNYQRDWARNKRAQEKGKNALWGTVAGGRPSRAKKPPRKPGECTSCMEIKPPTSEFFQPLKRGSWTGLSSECRECRKSRFRKHYSKNRARYVARSIAYAKSNPEKKNAKDAARYASTIAPQCPSWADRCKIEAVYAIADLLTKMTGVEYQVDHVYPLRGKTCSGLHVPENLRVITALANQQKGNRIDVAYDTWREHEDGAARDDGR